jgi:hypothetical protein
MPNNLNFIAYREMAEERKTAKILPLDFACIIMRVADI